MITLDSRSREPIYSQLEKQIIKLINLGIYEKDSMLPSVRQMAMDLRINPNTVAKAYKILESKNILYTVAGKGVFVNSNNTKAIQLDAIKDVENALIDAKNTGLKKQDIINIVNNIWKENDNDKN